MSYTHAHLLALQDDAFAALQAKAHVHVCAAVAGLCKVLQVEQFHAVECFTARLPCQQQRSSMT